ncbi:hypothetical protein HB662_24475 [Roseomonas frigidaquae]|uniref:Uncharacterized protein n=1 Tax=Falsiroseomonas frigidaquae TaxID=487318 RepID=A0ABX1F6V8_9PROT|nr:hypothetical protein [Falsiroseomonas frigidaquae]NKE47956.1 hypothetical protein [Falsiroseomonas frigidaquae]
MVRISVDLPEEVAAALQAAARALQSTPETLAAAAIRDRVADQAALEAELAQAEVELEAGLGVPHDEVMQEMHAWAAGIRARHAGR